MDDQTDFKNYCLNKATEYQWYKDNNALFGETQRVLKNLVSGKYHLVIKNSSGCKNRSIEKTIVVSGAEVEQTNELTLVIGNFIKTIAGAYLSFLKSMSLPSLHLINPCQFAIF